MPWVVLDSTVFGGTDRYLQSTAGQLLCEESAAGRVLLAVPEVVLLESAANHERAVRAAKDKLAAARDALEQLRALQERDVGARAATSYRDDLDEILAEAGAQILPVPEVAHERLIGKAVARRRPFDAKGDGYRDALVWENVVELLDRGPHPVLLVSNDHVAFSETKTEPKLASDLVAELKDHGHSGRVTLYFDIREFTAQLPRARELAADWSRELAENADFKRNLTEYLIRVALDDATKVIGDEVSVATVRNTRFVDVGNPRDLRVEEAFIPPNPRSTAVGLDVALKLDYVAEYEIALPDPVAGAKSWSWLRTTSEGTAVFKFQVLQHDRHNPSTTTFGARLLGWSNPTGSLASAANARSD